MMNSMVYSLMLFMMGSIGFLKFNKHIIQMLLMLEFMLLGIILLVVFNSCVMITSWLILMVLFIMVCESVMGIGGLILISRIYGNEMMESLNLLQW